MKTFLNTMTLLVAVAFLFPFCGQRKTTEQSGESASSDYRLTRLWASDTLLRTPESVIYDELRDVLYVANVNMNPWEKDGNGFISKLSTSGEILNLKWVEGMNGPKGMGIVGNTLFVADLDELVLIDLEKEVLQEKIIVPGATGMNDITAADDGTVYISDSPGGKIFVYANGQANVFHDDVPGRPNGLLAEKDRLLVAFSQAAEFVAFDRITRQKTVIATEIGAGDGVTPTNQPGSYLVSDWNGEIFIIHSTGEKQSLLNTKDEKIYTADIWLIPGRNMVLVPTFYDNRIVAYRLER